jgi:hypothetical protein
MNNLTSWGANVAGKLFDFGLHGTGTGTVGAARIGVYGGYAVGSTVLTDGKWHIIAVTFGGASTTLDDIKLYLDGTLENWGYVKNNPTIDTTSSDIEVGDGIGGTHRFEGDISFIYIFDAELSATRIAQITANPYMAFDKGGRASDGALQLELDANKEAKLTIDRTRIKMSQIIHDAHFYTGSKAAPDDHLLCHLKCDENAASPTLADSSGLDNDATWRSISGPADRDTDTAGDSVVEIGRGRNLDTQDGTSYIEIPLGSGTIHDNAFFKNGSIIITIKPQFNYDAAYQALLQFNIDTNNSIGLGYDSGQDAFDFAIKWGGGSWHQTYNTDYSYTDNISLQRQHILLMFWSYDFGILGFVVDGKVHNVISIADTPSSGSITDFVVGCFGNLGSAGDYIIDEIKTYDKCILPYGAIFTGNGEVDTDLAHGDITLYLDQEDKTDTAPAIGSATISQIGTCIDVSGPFGDGAQEYNATNTNAHEVADFTFPDDFTMDFWYKNNGSAPTAYGKFICSIVTDTSLQLNRNNSNTSMWFDWGDTLRATFNGLPNVYDEVWHYIELMVSVTLDDVRIKIDGVDYPYASKPNAVSNIHFDDTFYIGNRPDRARTINGIIDNFTITNDPNTPQIWTALGAGPKHMLTRTLVRA